MHPNIYSIRRSSAIYEGMAYKHLDGPHLLKLLRRGKTQFTVAKDADFHFCGWGIMNFSIHFLNKFLYFVIGSCNNLT